MGRSEDEALSEEVGRSDEALSEGGVESEAEIAGVTVVDPLGVAAGASRSCRPVQALYRARATPLARLSDRGSLGGPGHRSTGLIGQTTSVHQGPAEAISDDSDEATHPGGLVGLLDSLIRDIAGYPQPGIVFKDITPVLADRGAYGAAVAAMAAPYLGRVDKVAAIEARGFILGAPVAFALGAGLVPVRKLGKLPAATMSAPYALEYGEDVLEMHVDALAPGERVLVVDDVIATGGTANAAIGLVEQAGAEVIGISALLEIAALGGRSRLVGRDVRVLLSR